MSGQQQVYSFAVYLKYPDFPQQMARKFAESLAEGLIRNAWQLTWNRFYSNTAALSIAMLVQQILFQQILQFQWEWLFMVRSAIKDIVIPAVTY